MSVATINTKVAEAVTAIEAGDYTTAQTKLESATILLAALPDQEQDGTSLRWDRSAIQRMLEVVAKKVSAANGVVRQTMTWKRPDLEVDS